MVQIRLFGYPEVIGDGVAVNLKRRKTLALLSVIASMDRNFSRSVLAGLLWPENTEKQALSYLRNAIWELNQTPFGPLLTVDRQIVRLQSSPQVSVDARQFRQLLSQSATHNHSSGRLCASCCESMEQAVALHQQLFLSGFSVQDCPEFDHWMRLEEQSLLRDYTRILHQLTDHYYYSGNWAAAARTVNRWISVEPFDENACRHGMIISVCAGQRNEAIRIYLRTRNLLSGELGVDPEPETRTLYEYVNRKKSVDELVEHSIEITKPQFPMLSTPFLGRSTELEGLSQLLLEDKQRLITVTGPGGCGKTRLAIETARQLESHFQHGIVWVNFDSTGSDDPLLPVIMNAVNDSLLVGATARLEFSSDREHTLLEPLVSSLKNRVMLMVLDNTEHITDRMIFLKHLLSGCPEIQFLVTSRERLNLSGEIMFSLEGLSYPDVDSLENPEKFTAVQLFMKGVKQRQKSRIFSDREVERIAEISRMVAGNPLALELAAAFTDVMSISEIQSEMEKDLGFLKTSVRDIPDRHRSLRTVFDHSWQHLPESGQAGFRKLAVFRGGFTRLAAMDISGVSLDDLAFLVSRSIIRRTTDNRFRIHDTLRQFALERLRKRSGEYHCVNVRHARFYLRWLSTVASGIGTYRQRDIIGQIRQEFENIRSGWMTASQNSEYQLLLDALDGLFFYFDICSRFHQGWEMFHGSQKILDETISDSLEKNNSTMDILVAKIQGYQGWFLRYIDKNRGKLLMEESADKLAGIQNDHHWAFIETLAAMAGFRDGSMKTRETLKQCREIFLGTGDTFREAFVLEALAFCGEAGFIPDKNHDHSARLASARESLNLRKNNGDIWGMALSYYTLAVLDQERGEYGTARDYYRKSLLFRKKSGNDSDGIVDCLLGLARLEFRLGQLAGAMEHAREALVISMEIENHGRIATATELITELELELKRKRRKVGNESEQPKGVSGPDQQGPGLY